MQINYGKCIISPGLHTLPLFSNLEETAGVSDIHLSVSIAVCHPDDRVWHLNSSVLLLCYAVCHSDDIPCHLKGTAHTSTVKNIVSEKFIYAIPSVVLFVFMVVCGMFSMHCLSKIIIPLVWVNMASLSPGKWWQWTQQVFCCSSCDSVRNCIP